MAHLASLLGIPRIGALALTAGLCGALAWGAVAYIRSDERAQIEAERTQQYIEGTQDARDALTDLPDNAVDGLSRIPF